MTLKLDKKFTSNVSLQYYQAIYLMIEVLYLLRRAAWVYRMAYFKGRDSNYEIKLLKFKSLQMKQLPCIKQYVLG